MGDSLDDLMASGLEGAEEEEVNQTSTTDAGIPGAEDPPHFEDIDWASQARQDDEDINRIFAEPGQQGAGFNFEAFAEKDLDQTGKADDAEDYEDISDLASDDESVVGRTGDVPAISQDPGLTEDSGDNDTSQYPSAMNMDDDDDDLFADGEDDEATRPAPSSPQAGAPHDRSATPPAQAGTAAQQTVSDEEFNSMTAEQRFLLNFPQQQDDDVNAWLLDQAKQDTAVPAPPQTIEQLLEQSFPGFQPRMILNNREYFPEWPAEYVYKEPPRDPPELVPTKLELDLEADSSKLFRIPESALVQTQRKAQKLYSDGDEQGRLMGATAFEFDEALSDSDNEDELVGGHTLAEIITVCDDWDNIHDPPKLSATRQNGLLTPEKEMDDMEDDWDREFMTEEERRRLEQREQLVNKEQTAQQYGKKRRRLDMGLPDISTYDSTGIDNFSELTKKAARRIQLDLNDPYLLIEDVHSGRPNKRPRIEEKTKRMANGQLGRDINSRFNISNDEAYSALKTNNKSKVRATLSNLAVEHSMPALKLAFPFYRTKLTGEFWEHHRRRFDVDKYVRHAISFRRPSKIRKRDFKGKSTQMLFQKSKDLTLNDNAPVILFEYSEQTPTLLSNYGMGNRVINYYRRKDPQDEEKPARTELGEPYMLLPEDRSPFSIFGTVDAGETVPTLHNEMYRAPIFKHDPRENDFLLGFQVTKTDAPRFYLRGIDHMYVVGQTFPSVLVPGPHGRDVTKATKTRLRMVAYRMMKKSRGQEVSLDAITPHAFEKKDPQNRQKMKEFLQYDRDARTYKLKEGESMPDEAAIRAMIKPEEVCQIEAMQVGQASLINAGYDPRPQKDGEKEKDKDKEDDDDADAERPLALRMAPWELTKNFIEASAGKAMVALHGEGDPTGHGLGFSFIKTSMKGGYINAVQGPLATSADAIERERKANGGHSYNVKKQQDMYNTAIQGIWARQKETLSDGATHDDADLLDTTNEDDRFETGGTAGQTPAPTIDESRSQLSRGSGVSRVGRRKIRITRKKLDENGDEYIETVAVDNPAVIKAYLKQRKEREEAKAKVYELLPTGNADADRSSIRTINKELLRLQKNKERRQVREKQGKGKKKKNHKDNADSADGNGEAASPDPSASADKVVGGTTRKCANCGQVGHIKTNKSKCPMLNGTQAPNNAAQENGGFGSFGAPAPAPSVTGSANDSAV